MLLGWKAAVLVASALALVAWTFRGSARYPAVGAFAGEAGLVFGLYALWQLAGSLALTRVAGAQSHGLEVARAQRWLHLPREATVQGFVLPHPLLVQASNLYYATMHVPAVIVLLVWLFVRHREQYPRWRTVLAVLTLSALLIQLIPVAPPRLLPGLGVIDTGHLFGQSVYRAQGAGFADQLAAMPSVHVGWAVLVAMAALRVTRSHWRWLAVAHAAVTVVVVVVTGNHFWLDGIVAVGLLALCWLAVGAVAGIANAARAQEPATTAEPVCTAVPAQSTHSPA